MGENNTLLGRIVTWTLVGFMAIVAIKITLSILGFAIGIAAFLLFTVGPILLVGWVAVKAWRAFTRQPAT